MPMVADSSEFAGDMRHSTPDNVPRNGFGRMDSLEKEAERVTGMEQHSYPRAFTMAVTLRLAFQTMGIVYGDVGTSPLYVFDSIFPNGINHKTADLLGATSLIIYTLTLISILKYVFIVLRANDRGDGGTFALYSLICRHANVSLITNQNPEDREVSGFREEDEAQHKKPSLVKQLLESSTVSKTLLLIVTLLGTCMVIGDGVLTPAISVLSAVQGIKVQATTLNQDTIVGISVAILVLLFSVQKLGTDKVGFMFAPAVFVWFMMIGIIGVYNIFKHEPGMLRAFNPKYIYDYFKANKKDGWISLGGVVLCITGTEAMFADLGHFSVRAIQIGFTSIVFPSLLAAYIGQAAYLFKHPEDIGQTFYKSIPGSIYWPMFVVAVIAAIIASQAMISATFSIIKQSLALGCFPRVKIVHTSKKFVGQIYIPEMNWLLMILCIIITAGFRSTAKIGNAYGICVVAVMLVTTSLLTIIMLMIWRTNIFLILAFLLIFGSVEVVYFSSVLYKFKDGGWLPLLFAGIFLAIMSVWHYGTVKRYEYEMMNKISMDWVVGLGSNLGVVRVPGVGLAYTKLALGVPAIFSHYITNLPAMHSVLIFVCLKYLPISVVPERERFLFRRVGPKAFGMYRAIVRYGYQDTEDEHETFQSSLFYHLKEFLKSDSLLTESAATVADQRHFAEQQLQSTSLSIYPSNNSIMPSDIRRSDESTGAVGTETEVAFLERSIQAGVVYIMGQTEVRASRESSFVKGFLIDIAYSFLRKNSRESRLALHIPSESLLKVGMINYV
ncbi:hypothetical protein O6H91_03G123600 [Diphasiastrum complanatum]|uniref:Uncharacterized protein n=1 Tax=Diphasiastrum complanatum TaxID=34168 RepID=A0ACC2EB60_DIPCM|nr:hypothetical protein O6H91_03G123600 [Diphasiastrum complanatum]